LQSLGGQHIAKKLVRKEIVPGLRQVLLIEHLREVAICEEYLFPGTLEVTFR